ncbi:MAG: NADH-quinone oxidoreductase subunit C, partial [candidate division Zixibacteria bacterium]|nr:NADH-quinone oxidoreductase subunit C [candidate division Zixibacteria bacterium]
MTKEEIVKTFLNKFPEKIEKIPFVGVDAAFKVDKDLILKVCQFAKETPELSFDLLACQTCIDYSDHMEVVYNLFSFTHRHKIAIKTSVSRDGELDSATPVWNAANWHEREIAELFGITFKNHPDPRPILLPEGWDQGFPMRKDWEG